MVLFQMVLMYLGNLNLMDSLRSKKEGAMEKRVHRLRLFVFSLLETVWAIETSLAAGALPA
jgi:uncharacterized protein YhhL (DUF1145 family)